MAKIKQLPNEDLKPWERQPNEGPQAYNVFCAYRDSGVNGAKRSLQKTAESTLKKDGTPYKYSTLRGWSRKYNWQARCNAFDDEMDRQAREELIKGITSMRKNHVGIAQAMLTKALKALQRIPEDELTPQDIARMVDIAAKLERISRGEATERTEGTHKVAGDVHTKAVLEVDRIDLTGLTDEELSELDEITSKLAAE